ncbi:ORF72 [Retroperitoneal fibromatosis-associated herpesvirus]|uniref:ORF72 n=1 Tax=Retroperitoneal fibromatosis-associated herpesvirus TaxID=111469 RepID=U5NJ04_9GAMA|nr:ORF72 [Retroperitoneal fibromatosis-associated herpesvirus]AGY30759.1 ORF72 [Retroperitoneal fibromatosis-associated herpesvirus]
MATLGSKYGILDAVLCEDRVLANILSCEGTFVTSAAIFGTIQRELSAYMRTRLGAWLLCVADDYSLSSGCLALALNILDRFLALQPVTRSEFQKVGAACLLIASKIRNRRPISVSALCFLAADCFSCQELIQQEKEVLDVLKWRSEAIVATDVTACLLYRLDPVPDQYSAWHRATNSLIDRALVDPRAGTLRASVLSAACCALAASTLETPSGLTSDEILQRLAAILSREVVELKGARELVTSILATVTLDILGEEEEPPAAARS